MGDKKNVISIVNKILAILVHFVAGWDGCDCDGKVYVCVIWLIWPVSMVSCPLLCPDSLDTLYITNPVIWISEVKWTQHFQVPKEFFTCYLHFNIQHFTKVRLKLLYFWYFSFRSFILENFVFLPASNRSGARRTFCLIKW